MIFFPSSSNSTPAPLRRALCQSHPECPGLDGTGSGGCGGGTWRGIAPFYSLPFPHPSTPRIQLRSRFNYRRNVQNLRPRISLFGNRLLPRPLLPSSPPSLLPTLPPSSHSPSLHHPPCQLWVFKRLSK